MAYMGGGREITTFILQCAEHMHHEKGEQKTTMACFKLHLVMCMYKTDNQKLFLWFKQN